VPEADHPAQRLDEVVHQRVRLGILAVLAEADHADFAYLKESLGLTDGNLSRHLRVLEDAGMVQITKGFEGKRPRTWVAATRSGRAAFGAEIAALRELIAGTEGAPRRTRRRPGAEARPPTGSPDRSLASETARRG
jgi:DNA-binding MarR family transcriptional regulator